MTQRQLIQFFAIILSLNTSIFSQSTSCGIAFISSLEGTVTIREENTQQAENVKLHDTITFTNPISLETSKESNTFFKLSNDISLALFEDSQFTVETFNQVPFQSYTINQKFEPSESQFEARLDIGSIAIKTKKLSPLSSFEIHLPNLTLEFFSAECLIAYRYDILQIALYSGSIKASFNQVNRSLYLSSSQYYETDALAISKGNIETIHPIEKANDQWSNRIRFLNYDHQRVYFIPNEGTHTHIASGAIKVPKTYFEKSFESPKTFK